MARTPPIPALAAIPAISMAFFCAPALAQPIQLPQPPAPTAPVASRLARIVLDAFGDRDHPGWDRDFSGALTPREITLAVLDRTNTGDRAAAAAALHDWLIVIGPASAPKLDRAFFEKLPAFGRPTLTPASADSAQRAPGDRPPSSSPATPTNSRRPTTDTGVDLDARFYLAGGRLNTARNTTALFPSESALFAHVRQGELGDCYLLSPLAALAYRDPGAVRQMIVPVDQHPGRYRVTFAGGKSVEVDKPTDGELALPGAGARPANGLWVRIIEKAYGYLDVAPAGRQFHCATDFMQGGEATSAAAVLTGHTFEFVHLIGNYRKPVSEGDLASAAAAVRGRLTAALDSKHLVLASNDGGMPPSIIDHHSYAVIGFDPATDRVEIYNTWSERFRPKGPEGFENGYIHDKGIAHVPLKEFVHAFTNLVIETDRTSLRSESR